MACIVRLVLAMCLALAAQSAQAGPIGAAEAGVILGKLTTANVWRCINTEERGRLDKQQDCGSGDEDTDWSSGQRQATGNGG